MGYWTEFWLCFVLLFVAVDAVGVLPAFIAVTKDMQMREVQRIIYYSVATAMVVAVGFMLAGTAILTFLGITVGDFMIAGGILLFVLAMGDLLAHQKLQRPIDPNTFGAVPLGVPLITGPAVLTTSILLVTQRGLAATAAALVINILIAGVAFRFAAAFNRLLGSAGASIVSKIASLFLAAIGVMMVRRGFDALIAAGHVG